MSKAAIRIVLLVSIPVLALSCKSLPVTITVGETEAPPATEPAEVIPTATDTPIPPTATPAVSPACEARLGELVAESEDDVYDADIPEEAEEYTLVTYQVENEELAAPVYEEDIPADYTSYAEDTRNHEAMWKFFTDVIPADQRGMVTNFVVFSDGYANTMGAVEQTGDDPYSWMLEMDPVDGEDFSVMSTTLVHEFGHLLTLNDQQIVVNEDVFNNPDSDTVWDQAEAACDTYFTDEGCSTDSAYLYDFFERFWPDIYDEWLEIDSIADEDEYYDALDSFYNKYSDQFVTDYAVTNPEEDIADSWMYFVFNPAPTGDSIADEKVLFFYDYPELVELRGQIRAGLCPYLGE
jgi:hypothetical protein